MEVWDVCNSTCSSIYENGIKAIVYLLQGGIEMEIMNIGYVSLKLLIILGLFVVSEVVLAISINKSKKDDSIWLAINILLPVVGCIIFMLTHRIGNKTDN